MESLSGRLMLGGSVAALLAAISTTAVYAQDEGASETITVSGSRISIQGYEAPTPVTVLDAATLTRDAKIDIGASIRELPSVGQSYSPDTASNSGQGSQGNANLNTVNLRNLGNIRTLVLFDGQRVVTSNPNNGTPPFAVGGVDLSTIPQSVIQRVDVVTGGASAAWGSDAVAGVTNLVINKTFSGIRGSITYGITSNSDRQQYRAELFVGTDVLGGRGHVEFAANYVMSPDAVFNVDRNWYWGSSQIVPRTALGLTTGPTFVTVKGAIGQSGSARQTNGGLITANPAGTVPGSANILAGTQFVGPNAQAVPFNFGYVNGSNCIYCSATPYTNTGLSFLSVPYHNTSLFNYNSYRLTDNITASLQLNYGQSYSQSTAAGRSGVFTIRDDNPYIPASVKSIMTANGITNFSLGTSNANNIDPYDLSIANIGRAAGLQYVLLQRQLMRGVFSLDGAYDLFGKEWTWNAYAQNSAVRQRQHLPYSTILTHYSNAIDAVTVTATGPNSLGGGNPVLANQVRAALTAAKARVPQVGDIACRSSLTATSWGTTFNPATGVTSVQPGGLFAGCQPLNLFGEGVASQAAINYIAPGRINKDYENQGFWYLGQSVFAVSTQGQLPWGLPAGNLAVAFGYEHRLEQQTNRRDPLQIGSSGTYSSGNFAQWQGHYYVDEGFLEVEAPLLKDQFVESLSFNAAGRMTNYSTSGMVQTWKLGLTSQVNQDFRLRTTLSADIRAPSVAELFSQPLFATSNIAYPPANGPLYSQRTANSGNPNLKPEQAVTVTGGVVMTPHWIDGLTLSFDWYSITIKKAIYANSREDILNQCYIGNPIFCSVVFFGKGYTSPTTPVAQEIDGNGNPATGFYASLGTFPADCEGCFNLVFISPLNATSESTSGLDFQIDYQSPLWDGVLGWRFYGNYTDQRTQTVLGNTFNGAGIYGGGGFVNPLAGLTMPRFRGTLTSSYTQGPYNFTVQTRLIGSARIAAHYVSGIDIDHNWVAPVAYLDLRGSYQWGENTQLFWAIDNTLNIPPQRVGGAQVYDQIGRSFRIGVRFDD